MLEALKLSWLVAFCAASLGLPFCLWLSRWIHRHSGWLESMVLLPLVFPPIVTGYVLVELFSPRAPLGKLLESLGIHLVLNWKGAVVAATLISLPLGVEVLRAAWASLDPAQSDAARSCGASESFLFWTVWVPSSWPSLVTAWLLMFARSLGEFGATVLIAGNIPGSTQTLSLGIYSAISTGNEETAMKLTLLLCLSALWIIAVIRWLDHRRG